MSNLPSGYSEDQPIETSYEQGYKDAMSESFIGLTKRELFAAMAMQGLLAADPKHNMSSDDIAKYAIEQADDLIKALNHEAVK